jgi:transcriptional regulator with XRE-family HTH domain
MEENKRQLTYLRRERLSWGLTQGDLATLIGYRGSDHLSRIERGLRPPSRDVVLVCRLLFGRSAQRLFPEFYAEIEERVMRGLNGLVEKLEGDESLKAARKREFAQRALARAVNRLKNAQ